MLLLQEMISEHSKIKYMNCIFGSFTYLEFWTLSLNLMFFLDCFYLTTKFTTESFISINLLSTRRRGEAFQVAHIRAIFTEASVMKYRTILEMSY